MKLLMTTDAVGGVFTYSRTLCRALQDHGVEITLAVKGQLNPAQRAALAAIPNVDVQARDYKLEWMEDPWQDVEAAGQWLMQLATEKSPDIIHLNDYAHGALSWDAPVVMVGHSCVYSWFEAVRKSAPDASWECYREQVRRGLNAADLVVAPTAHMLERLDHFYGPLPNRRVIMNGCEGRNFHARAKQPFVFAAGRFWDEGKNLSSLAEAAPDIPWPVYVAGLDHPDGHQGRRSGVQWLGALSPAEMADTYALAAIFAHPALYEPFGLTPLEAAMARCALVLGDVPSLREIWGNAAIYVDPRNPAQLRRALTFLIGDREYRTQLAERAWRRARMLTADAMGRAYMAAYQHFMALESKAASPGERF